MSTKIYTAYRMKDSKDFWTFLRDVRREGVRKVQEVLRQFYHDALEDVNTEGEEYKQFLAKKIGPEDAKRYVVERLIKSGYQAQLGKLDRNIFDFDVSIAVREHEGRLYLVPYCDSLMRHALDFLAEDPRLEDFSYYNNADKPEGISQEEWDQRGAIWDVMDQLGEKDLYKSTWDDYVVIEICSYGVFWKVCPQFGLEERKKKALKKVPSK